MRVATEGNDENSRRYTEGTDGVGVDEAVPEIAELVWNELLFGEDGCQPGKAREAGVGRYREDQRGRDLDEPVKDALTHNALR